MTDAESDHPWTHPYAPLHEVGRDIANRVHSLVGNAGRRKVIVSEPDDPQEAITVLSGRVLFTPSIDRREYLRRVRRPDWRGDDVVPKPEEGAAEVPETILLARSLWSFLITHSWAGELERNQSYLLTNEKHTVEKASGMSLWVLREVTGNAMLVPNTGVIHAFPDAARQVDEINEFRTVLDLVTRFESRLEREVEAAVVIVNPVRSA